MTHHRRRYDVTSGMGGSEGLRATLTCPGQRDVAVINAWRRPSAVDEWHPAEVNGVDAVLRRRDDSDRMEIGGHKPQLLSAWSSMR